MRHQPHGAGFGTDRDGTKIRFLSLRQTNAWLPALYKPFTYLLTCYGVVTQIQQQSAQLYESR